MRRVSFLLPVAIGFAVFAAPLTKEEVERPKPEYVGAGKCKVCHLVVFNSWSKTSHASALSSLKPEEKGNQHCLRCHTTGYGQSRYEPRPGLSNLAGVQCEACHGPGSLYSRSSVMRNTELSGAFGLASIDSSTCTACHNQESPTFKGFAYRKGLLTGTHILRVSED
jgi:hypothetical protein